LFVCLSKNAISKYSFLQNLTLYLSFFSFSFLFFSSSFSAADFPSVITFDILTSAS